MKVFKNLINVISHLGEILRKRIDLEKSGNEKYAKAHFKIIVCLKNLGD